MKTGGMREAVLLIKEKRLCFPRKAWCLLVDKKGRWSVVEKGPREYAIDAKAFVNH